MSEHETSEERAWQARLAAERTQLIGTAISMLIATWWMMPEWQRKAILLRAIARTRTALHCCARLAGRTAMRRELAFGMRDGYQLPYALAQLVDRLDAWQRRINES